MYPFAASIAAACAAMFASMSPRIEETCAAAILKSDTRNGPRTSGARSSLVAILFRSIKFQGFNFAVSQAAVVFPFIVQAPRLLSRQITLGDVMQTAQSFGQVESALSFFRTSYDDFAGYRAVVSRLSGFLELTESTERLGGVRTQPAAQTIAVRSLTVRTAANLALVKDLSFELPPSSSLLIRGQSGVGKTTLLRAIAGLWPYAQGTVVRPGDQQSLFLPQKP